MFAEPRIVQDAFLHVRVHITAGLLRRLALLARWLANLAQLVSTNGTPFFTRYSIVFVFLVVSCVMFALALLQYYPLPETNIAPEDRPSQKESSIPTIHFQGLC